MKVTTAEKGQLEPPEAVEHPEHALDHILLPVLEVTRTYHIRSPRLKHREQTTEFFLKVIEEKPDAAL